MGFSHKFLILVKDNLNNNFHQVIYKKSLHNCII